MAGRQGHNARKGKQGFQPIRAGMSNTPEAVATLQPGTESEAIDEEVIAPAEEAWAKYSARDGGPIEATDDEIDGDPELREPLDGSVLDVLVGEATDLAAVDADAQEVFDRIEAFKEIVGVSETNSVADKLNADDLRECVIHVLNGGNVREITEKLIVGDLAEAYATIAEQYIRFNIMRQEHGGRLTMSDLIGSALMPADNETKGVRKRLTAALRDRGLMLIGLPAKTASNLFRKKKSGEDGNVNLPKWLDWTQAADNKEIERLRNTGFFPEIERAFGTDDPKTTIEAMMGMMWAAGAATLKERGAAKSRNGKRLEREVLTSLSKLTGFKIVEPGTPGTGVCWLSHQDGNIDREVDLTMVLPNGEAVKIDIGFIGRGNPEIPKDKLSRYSRRAEIGGVERNVHTIIIVDEVSKNSGVWGQAKELDATLLEMSDPNWVHNFASTLTEKHGVKAPDWMKVWSRMSVNQRKEMFDVLLSDKEG